MKQIAYVMQFIGQATPDGPAANLIRVSSRAASCRITSVVGPGGVQGRVETLAGGEAVFDSEVRPASETAFDEVGSIAFGDAADRVHFSTVGSGCMGPSADPALKQGCVSWRIDRGEGRLSGASGFITSNFTLGARGEVTDTQVGVIFLP